METEAYERYRMAGTALIAGLALLGAVTPQARAQQPGAITGTVTTTEGQALESASVEIPALSRSTATRRGGTFRFESVPPGEYRLHVDVIGYRDVTRTVSVAAGQTARVDIELSALPVQLSGVEVSVLRPDLQPQSRLQEEAVREANPRDAAEALKRIPGVDGVRRGPLGQDPVIRGLRESEVGAYLDGTRLFPAGPARMDSPLTHLDPSAVQTVEVVKGPYALTWGAGNLAAIRVETQGVPPRVPGQTRGRFLTGYDGNLDAQEYSGALFGSTDRFAWWGHGVWREGDDYDSGDDILVPADFESWEGRGKFGVRTGEDAWLTFSGGYQEQGPIDYPGRLLKADFFETLNLSSRWELRRDEGLLRSVDLLAYVNDVEHGMTNDGKPTAESNPNRMPPFPLLVTVASEMRVSGGRAGVTLAPGAWTVELGGDVYSANRDAVRTVARRDNGMEIFVDLMWPDATITDGGLWARVERALSERVRASGALRVDFVDATADTIGDFFSENVGTDLDDTETNLSAAFTLSANLDESWAVSGAVGTAVRTAEVLERYSDRIPATKVQLSNEFMGNPGLDPERSTQLDLWVEGSFSRFSLSVNGFWRTIDDYITVEATELPKRLPLSPPTVFRYINGEASFYGAEGSVRAFLTNELTTTLGVAWLEGEDETFDEPALGIAPLEGELELRYERRDGRWFAEGVWTLVDEQDEVAEIRGEEPTPGFGLVDVQAGVQLADGVLLRAGVNNLFDRNYVRHLTAKNPFTGDRILEPGAVWFVRLGYSF